MYTCRICQRKFRTEQALGGHMVNAHPQKPDGDQLESASPVVETTAAEAPEGAGQPSAEAAVVELAPAPPGEEGIAEQIREYLGKGYTFQQLTGQFGFSATSVRREMEKLVPPQGEASQAGQLGDGLPVARKVGQGVEVLNPEVILRTYVDGDDDLKEFRGMMKLRAAMLMVSDLINMRKADAEAFALEVKPILDLMKETRAEQDAAALRAREAGSDIAREAASNAAEETAARVAAYFDQRKPDIASTSDPIKGMFARVMETLLNRVTGTALGGGQPGEAQLPPGWSDTRNQGGAS